MRDLKHLHIVFLDFDDIRNPLLAAGQARASLEVGKRLVKKGHTFTIICSKYPGYHDRIEEGIIYKHIGISSKNIRFNNIVYILTIPFIVVRLKADILVECFTSPISTLFSPLFTKIPVVALPTSFEAERFSELYHLPFDKIENFGLRFYKYFLPYTDYQDKKMKLHNPQVISKLVPQGVDDEFHRIKRLTSKYILFLGRLDMEQKGVDLLLRAYAHIKDSILYPLVIAGHGPDEDKIRSLIKELKLEKYVQLVGGAYGKKKAELLSHALYVAFPSRHEGFSLFSLEALAAGTPLVAFDIPGLSWAGDKVSYKAEPFNSKSYALMLMKATDKKLLEIKSKQSRELASKYTWENVTDQFNKFFQNILR